MKLRYLTIVISLFITISISAQENAPKSLLASYSTPVKFSPAPDLSPQEIEMKVNAINPYTLYRKGSVAEYAFEKDGKPAKFDDNPVFRGFGYSYIQQIVVDERVENGLLVAYIQQAFFNKKHQPSKELPKSIKSYYYPTEIDTAGVYHFTHDINRDYLPLRGRKGYAMVIPSNLKVGDILQCNTIKDITINGLGGNVNYTTTYSNFKVVAEERITTPAGTFDCLKLTGTADEKKSGDYTYSCLYNWWIARGIGIVRYEIYENTNKGLKKPPFVIYLNKLDLK